MQKEKELIQLGNVSPPRAKFDNPEEGRVYSPLGLAPCCKAEGQAKMVAIPCALRTRAYCGKGERLEIRNSAAANAVTSVAKDSMIMELRKIVGFSRSSEGKGEVERHILKDTANAVTSFSSSAFTTAQYVFEPRVRQIGQLRPKPGSGFDNPQYGRVYDPTGLSPAITKGQGGDREPKILTPMNTEKPKREPIVVEIGGQRYELVYCIRKLTPRELYRFQDVEDADIDKMFAYREPYALKDGTVKERKISETAHCKLAGNSIAVGCLEAIFESLLYPQSREDSAKNPSDPLNLFNIL